MSAFLGPIHVKMYDRILHQDNMTQAILEMAAGKGWSDKPAKEADLKAPAASTQPLEDIIDATNIHGWLSEAVARCEQRFAIVVCGLLADDNMRMDEMAAAMKELGKQHAVPSGAGAEEAYQLVHDILLDGMPCDFPFELKESTRNAVAWDVANCPHTPYWESAGGRAETYYDLRDAWLEGALEQSGIVHVRPALYSHALIMR